MRAVPFPSLVRSISPWFLFLLLAQPLLANEQEGEALFVRRIAPLLAEKCLACHGQNEDEIEGGFDMRSLEGLKQGGDSGESSLVAGKPEESPLMLAILRDDFSWSAMPPKEAEKLNDEQVGWVRRWIALGAPWPDQARAAEINAQYADKWSAEDGITVETVGALSEDWANRKYKPEALWAYQKVTKPDVPDVGAGNPIDAFVLAQMPEGLKVAPSVDRQTLIRRATFDLTGLPPSPQEIEAFVSDPSSDEVAFAKVVDRLLASPHYGERMAQHWLDVARYADTSGFANDYERGNAWRYRDYVVRSFNEDKPYDEFIRQQIAGDELDPDNPEAIVATGFLRMGPWELTGMEVEKVARQRFLDDVTNSVGETFLAHSLQCARCHDHKFDPVPTHDYYAIQAVFATTQLAERKAPFLDIENTDGFEEKKYLQARRAEYSQKLQQLDEMQLKAAQAWYAENKIDPTKWNEALAKQKGKKDFGNARQALMRQKLPESEIPPKHVGFSPEDYGNERVARKGLQRLKWEEDRYEPYALAVYSGKTPTLKSVYAPLRVPAKPMQTGELEQTCILTGGDPFSQGTPVSPSILSVLDDVEHPEIPKKIEGRRAAFTQWVASPDNPLTTRTIVNRIWLWHMGQPIAGNPNNFGSTGKRPTHPQLLDWLAATFVESGWSFKAMHRQIMLSEAYRRSCEHPSFDSLDEKDPLGTSYAVFTPRRLTASEIRDAMLFATGEMNPKLGGIPNRPEINMEAAMQPRQVMGTFASAWTPNPLPQQRHRRSLYSLKVRGLPDPFREVFNAPGPDFSCEMRSESTVTPQVFALFNGKATYDRALALANRVTEEGHTGKEAIERVFQLTYGRLPNESELAACEKHWKAMEAIEKERELAEAKAPLVVRRDAVEENTGEKFSFNETLHAYQDFVPDLQPQEVDAKTRALADVCLAILNSNEFVYVY
ncbi:PSD1 and planctomycete cytochrome C domain-containing protein [Bremerella sp. P1]|uniref:PSD1 and planctomycete cytochrome C domain-containing protein n=1 Tax=Bremerella sp. P1 TaxID=3026424 RepID=UPI00236823CD|nr:PSD1 and planctomycete cytochrome C domain-containing protein [Bremerella sp. P1]WDI42072.1 PSD1 and planctomycete cytochrome C domain-containing protein [Bremerella sp. P1]